MSFSTNIKKDYAANSGNRKGQFIVFFYRLSNHIYYNRFKIVRILGAPLRKIYHFTCKWMMGVEIPEQVNIGSSLQVWHGQGLVINPGVVIGSNILLRHCTTIGNKYKGSGAPRIGNNVEIGANTVIIGPIIIGDNVVIGAGSIVTKSIPSNSVAYGNPLQIKARELL